MKKRVLSMLLAFTLCFSTVPMTAFAQGTEVAAEQEEQQEETAPAAVQEEAEAVATPEIPVDENTTEEDSVTDEEIDIVSPADKSVSDSDAGEQNTVKNEENDAAVQAVQALIDALPEKVTAENADELQAQLMAIDEAIDTLTEEQIAALDMTRYEVICAALTGLVAVQADTHTHYLCGGDECTEVGDHTENGMVTFKAWTDTTTLPSEAGCYYLTEDVTLSSSWVPSSDVTLCLNGKKISGYVVFGYGKTYTLCDCDTKNRGTISGKQSYAVLISNTSTFNMYGGSIIEGVPAVEMKGGTFNMYGGSITQNGKNGASFANGGKGGSNGVTLTGGQFNMYGGSITDNDNYVYYGAGGVCVNNATFNMSGNAEISGNHIQLPSDSSGACCIAGGVLVRNGGSFTMSGNAKITSNTANVTDGKSQGAGGVYVLIEDNPGTFTMNGGSIENNIVTNGNGGGGVRVDSNGQGSSTGNTFTMNGGSIENNTATNGNGGGVYIGNCQQNKFTMTDNCSIKGNSASGNGGGIYSLNGEITMTGGKIADNTAGKLGGGVHIGDGSTVDFKISDGTITGNTAKTNGGGVYVGNSSHIFVSGWVNISKNTTDNKANNVYLPDGKTINIIENGLGGMTKIGVTTQSLPTDGNYITIATGRNKGYYYENIIGDQSDNLYTVWEVGDSVVLTRGKQHKHAICGKDSSDCTDSHDDALWQPLTYDETDGLKYGVYTAGKEETTGPAYVDSNNWDSINVYTLPTGNYYLTDDIAIDGTIAIGGNVNLCLNGHTLSTSKVSHAVLYTRNNELTISDCGKNGCLKAPNNGVTDVIRTSAGTTTAIFGYLYIYGGSITGGNYGVYLNGSVYMYGGSITGNSTGVEAGGITIGGDANITSNTVANVNLTFNRTVTIGDSLTQSARIGITRSPGPTGDSKIWIATGATNTSLDYFEIFTPDVKNKNYAISKDENGNLYLGIHQHSWTYTADGAAIRIRCGANGCNLGTDFVATYTVTAPTDLTYSGSGKAATVEASENATDSTLPEKPTVTYQKKSGNGYEALEGAPIDAGTYKASITMGDKTASVTYEIVSKVVTNPTIKVSDAGTYDGTAKTPSVVVKDGDNVISEDEYTVSYESNTNAGSAAVVKITDTAGGNYEISGSMTFTIDKATITVTPEADQKTIYGVADPALKYTDSGAVNGQKPAFTGALSRAEGKDAGTYAITLGTLALADNTAGNFKTDNYELKLADTAVQFTIVPKTLDKTDLEFTDSTITKTYDGTTKCTTATVQIKGSAKVNANDIVPEVAGTYAYNSPNVKDAKTVTFTSKETSTQNYILPAGLTVEHEANIDKAGQSPLFITSKAATYGTDLTLTVDGGSGNGALTYTVENGTGAATISGSVLHPVEVGEVTVVAAKAGDDNHYSTTSGETTITIGKGDYAGEAKKVVNIMRNRSDAQSGVVNVEDFFPKGQMPEGAWISQYYSGSGTMLEPLTHDETWHEIQYNSKTDITVTDDEVCAVTISSTNYNDIEATLIFHPTDKVPVKISGLTYTNKTYDGNAIQSAGTLQVTGGDVPVDELVVEYEGTGSTTYNSTDAPKNAGTYKVTYKVADSNETYTGSVEYTFTIFPKDVTADMIGAIADETYTGSAIKPRPAVMDGKDTMYSGTDFDFSYDKNIDAGENTATVIIAGKGNYTGTASRTFTIKPKDISGAKIELKNSSFTYDSIKKTVEITSVTLDGKTLTSLKDYEIKEGNEFISANDSITLTIAGKGNYTGTATTTWTIAKATPVLGNFDVTDLSVAQTYDGNPKAVTAKTKNGVIDMGEVTVYYEGTGATTYPRSTTAPTNAGSYKVILSIAEGANYTAAQIEAGTLTIDKAVLKVEDITEFFEYTKTGAQSISLADLVPGATHYTLKPVTSDSATGVLTGLITVNAKGLLEFTLSALTKANIDNKVTVPVTITSENYEDVTVNVTIYISPEYRIIDGAGSSWTQNTNGTVVIRGNGDYHIFKDVKVDGKVIDHSNYEVTEGSTIITLKAEYLKTLSAGSHTFAIVWNNGIAGTNFTVAANTSGNNGNSNSSNGGSHSGSNDSSNNTNISTTAATNDPAQEMDKVPATGDPSGIWLTLFVISLTGFAGMLVRRKKN